MNINFTFLLILLSFAKMYSQTSIYHPFPDSASRWNYQFGMNCLNGTISDETYTYTLDQDTIINSVLYHKLVIPFVQSNSIGTCYTHSGGYKGAVRENTVLKKIYFVPPGTTIEELLYDFNLQVGDTIKGYLPISAPSGLIIQSIDSVLTGTNYRKRWKTNSCYFVDIIEGIGSTYGLIEKTPCCETDMPYFSLICHMQNDTFLYPSTGATCDIITSYYHDSNPSVEIIISPNPSDGKININSNQKIIESLTAFDLTGRTVLSKKIQSTVFEIDLPAGVYLLELTVEGTIIKRKIIMK